MLDRSIYSSCLPWSANLLRLLAPSWSYTHTWSIQFMTWTVYICIYW